MDIYYENSLKEKIDLEEWPIVIQNKEDLYSNEWGYKTSTSLDVGRTISRFFKDVLEKELKLSIFADSKQEYKSVMNKFMKITEQDIYSMKQGKLYVGEYYINCYIVSSKYSEYEELFDSIEKTVKVVAENSQWVKEKNSTFRPNKKEEKSKLLKYPYNYLYNYSNDFNNAIITNENFAECNFEIKIYGKCSNPSIMIGSKLYNLNCTIDVGEYVVINSRTKKIIKYKYNGETENVFDYRNRNHDIFSKIKSGRSNISWNGLFSFDVTIFEERSEPLWI